MANQKCGWKKPIVAEVRFLPNFIFHILACARVGFESDYANRYADFLTRDQWAVLEKNQKLLMFGEGNSGELVQLVTFLPIWLEFESRLELAEYYDLLHNPGADRGFQEFFSRYSRSLGELAANWESVTAAGLLGRIPLLPALREIGDLYLQAYDKYEQEVWPRERDSILVTANWLSSVLAKRDFIAEWEKLLGREFKTDRYTILLCSAIAGGPNANSVGYDMNIFYSGSPRNWLRQFISHEVGTHLLIDALREMGESGEFGWQEVYAAYESLARYYNTRILTDEKLVYDLKQFDGVAYEELYGWLESHNPGIDPKQLLLLGLKKMRARRGVAKK